MTHDEKVEYLRIALALQKIGITSETSDRVVSTYEKVLELGGKFSLEDAVELEIYMDRKYIEKNLEDGN